MTTCRRCLLALTVVAMVVAESPTQVRWPDPPAEYDVTLRFLLRSPLPAWYDHFDRMVADLKRLGFQRTVLPEDGIEDPNNDRLEGIVSSRQSRRLLSQPLVQTVLLKPRGFLPTPGQPIKVRLELASGLPRESQKNLHRQVVERLASLGFKEGLGYHHEGFTSILGFIDSDRLPELLQDLRRVPNGWLVPDTPISTLPQPFRGRVPIRVIEVLPEPSDVAPPKAPPAPTEFPPESKHLEKVEPQLLAISGPQANDERALRVEVIFDRAPPPDDVSWEKVLRATGASVKIEGLVGNVATVSVRAHQATELARPNAVVAVRLPRSGEAPRTASPADDRDPWEISRLKAFHERGWQGQGIKIAVLAADFRGYEKFLGNRLPSKTRLVDLTIARNSNLEPDPSPESDSPGRGTLMALTVAAAAPKADIVLVRVDPAAPYQILMVARLINEHSVLPRVLEDRFDELERERTELDLLRAKTLEQRRRAQAQMVLDIGDSRVPEQRKRFVESEEKMKQADEMLAEIERKQSELRERTDRYLQFRESLQELRGTRVVVNPFVWESGWPVDASSGLSRYLDEKFVGDPGKASATRIRSLHQNVGTIWVNSAGDARGQSWAGQFRDVDGNGVMEFAPATRPLPAGRWTSELNFLSWRPNDGAPAVPIPAGTKLRVSLQWREPHASGFLNAWDDPFREPISRLQLLILRQRDPSGTKLGSDEMELVARSVGRPVRLHLGKNSGTYEIETELVVPSEGNYAVRVEGQMALSVRPAGDSEGERGVAVEIRPRLFVELTDPEARTQGRVVFADFADSDNVLPAEQPSPGHGGGIGMPADSDRILTVAAEDSFSSRGAGPGRLLALKPDVLGPAMVPLGDDLVARGSWGAAAFNAGLVACILDTQAVPTPRVLLQRLSLTAGSRLAIPESWLKSR